MVIKRKNLDKGIMEYYDTESEKVVGWKKIHPKRPKKPRDPYHQTAAATKKRLELHAKASVQKATFKDICMKLSQGQTITQILKEEGMPHFTTFHLWLHENPGMREEYRLAKEFKTHALADEALQVARDSKKKTVLQDRLRIDTLKWTAEVTNPKDYGKQTKIVGDADAPVTFLIDTGIRREEPKVIEMDSKKIGSDEES
jgi:hypothetical protein